MGCAVGAVGAVGAYSPYRGAGVDAGVFTPGACIVGPLTWGRLGDVPAAVDETPVAAAGVSGAATGVTDIADTGPVGV